jgi:hypothetical protein
MHETVATPSAPYENARGRILEEGLRLPGKDSSPGEDPAQDHMPQYGLIEISFKLVGEDQIVILPGTCAQPFLHLGRRIGSCNQPEKLRPFFMTDTSYDPIRSKTVGEVRRNRPSSC